GPGDAPIQAPAGDADVFEPALDPAQHLVAAEIRNAEVRVGAVQIFQRLLIFGQAEEVVLFGQALDRRPRRVDRALAVDEIALLVERLAGDAVQALVRRLVHVAVLDPTLHEPLDALDVIGIGSTDETIKRDVVEPRDLLIAGRKRVDEAPSLLPL